MFPCLCDYKRNPFIISRIESASKKAKIYFRVQPRIVAPLKNPYELKHLCFSWWCRYICQCDSAAPRGVCELARTLLDYFASRGSSTAAYLHQLCDGIFVFGGIGRRCKQGRGEEVKKLVAISGRVRASLRNDIIDRRKRAYLIGR